MESKPELESESKQEPESEFKSELVLKPESKP